MVSTLSALGIKSFLNQLYSTLSFLFLNSKENHRLYSRNEEKYKKRKTIAILLFFFFTIFMHSDYIKFNVCDCVCT